MPVRAYMISTTVKGPHQSGMIRGNASLIIPVAAGLGLGTRGDTNLVPILC
jgi:hypothetical protein